LRNWLSEAQRAQFDAQGCFEVVGGKTAKRYRIQHGAFMNILELDGDGHPKTGWCFAPRGSLVPCDVMLAQKLALEADELAALSVANRFMPGPRHLVIRRNHRPL
jgi:hypothetical protein